MELERDVEKHLLWSVERIGGLCIKHGQDGWPDRLVMFPDGTLVWVELKRKTGYESDLQMYRATQLAKVKQIVVCLYSKEEVDRFVWEHTEK